MGGLIRTVAGSGTMVVEPATIEQSSRNKNIKLTFTATTDFENLVLKIEAPSVIETELQEESLQTTVTFLPLHLSSTQI